MRKITSLIYALLISYNYCQAQSNQPDFNQISKENIIGIVDTLTSEYFEGRHISANDKLLSYFSNYYSTIGLDSINNNDYIQDFTFFKYKKYSDSSYIKYGDKKLEIGKDFIHSLWDYQEDFNNTRQPLNTSVVFVGKPSNKLDTLLKWNDLKGKSILAYNRNGNFINTTQYKGAISIIQIEASQKRFDKTKANQKITLDMLEVLSYYTEEPKTKTFTQIYLSPKAGAKLLGIKRSKLKTYMTQYANIDDSVHYNLPKEITLNIHREKQFTNSGNIVGYIQGSDINEDHIIVSAHYDHLGKNEYGMYPGANDNASGVGAMLEIARVLAAAQKEGIRPKRSVLFVAFGMEESRMLGSKHYIKNPILPLEKLKANINMDMIGRQDRYHDSIPNYIYALGPDSITNPIKHTMDSINNIHQFVQLEFLDNYPDAKRFFSNSSDQVNFLKQGIPAVLINNGIHKDLHKFTDTKDKLNYETIENVTKLMLMSVWELANQP
ncbi:MAG: M20/M25/M40 family metallo-hydrolase [Salinivirgaceae bacterium]|nr:M20/M25/M40 family metallo-hydrolase [Salinivirgaceae bacterium]